MSIVVSKIAPPFTLSFGEEDGLFAALMWPDELSPLPFSDSISATIVPQGFVLTGDEGEPAIAFLGVSDEVLSQLSQSDFTLMIPIDDDYDTRSIVVLTTIDPHDFDYSSASEL